MAKITLYRAVDFKWHGFEITDAVSNLDSISTLPDGFEGNLAGRVSSFKIESGAWILYQGADFNEDPESRDRFDILQPGEYANFEGLQVQENRLTSLRPLPESGLCLFQHENYSGHMVSLLEEHPNFVSIGINNKVSSAIVRTQTWELYQHIDYQGDHWTLKFGSYPTPESGGFRDQTVSSACLKLEDKVPRNMAWVEESTQAVNKYFNDKKHQSSGNSVPEAHGLVSDDFEFLKSSKYTHIIACFCHFDPPKAKGLPPNLVYNGPYDVDLEIFKPSWQKYRELQRSGKTVMLSMGGWGSWTWKQIRGNEEAAAKILADFVKQQGFDGVDLNFEGPPGKDDDPKSHGVHRENPDHLAALARFAVALHKELGQRLLTITPMVMPRGNDLRDNVVMQLEAIDEVLGKPAQKDKPAQPKVGAWQEILSWVNPQFYSYWTDINGVHHGDPEDNVPALYKSLLSQLPGPPVGTDRMTAGFPLEGAKASAIDHHFNTTELGTAEKAVTSLVDTYGSQFGGAFVWRYKFTKGESEPHTWDTAIDKALRSEST